MTHHLERQVAVLTIEHPPQNQIGDQMVAELAESLDVFNRLEQLPVPVIAAVQGMCLGGGFELALRADIILAGETAHFVASIAWRSVPAGAGPWSGR